MNQAIALDTHSACGNEPGLITVDEALQLILDRTQALTTECIGLDQALHRYLATPISSQINLPLFSQSAVDGYALCHEGEIEAGVHFELIGEIRAGQRSELVLQQGQAVRLFTGAKIPEHATTVARQEIVRAIDHQNMIKIIAALKPHTDIRDVGEEVAVGQCLAQAGQQLSLGALASLSMAGVQTVHVYALPKVAVVITGDEIADTMDELQSGKIFDANGPLIRAWFQQQHQHQHQQVHIFHVADSEYAVSQLFHDLKDRYDVILTTGGVSVGDYDFVRPVALNIGFKEFFWKVKQKPGKPMFFAEYARKQHSPCYLLGLPGNPAAVYVGMQVYVNLLIKALQGQKSPCAWFSGIIQHELKSDQRERFLRMYAQFEQGQLYLNSLSKQQSHMLSNLMQANCLVRIPANQNIQKGAILSGIFI